MINNIKKDKVILKCNYTPNDFFEDPYCINMENYNIKIDNGKIKVTMSLEFYKSKADTRDNISEDLFNLFNGAQTVNFKSFTLSGFTVHHIHPNGQEDITIFPKIIGCKLSLGVSADIIIQDKDRKIIEDTRAKRIEAKRHFAQLAAKYKRVDSIASAILNSYKNAINDPQNEFIHLYEIIESLCKKFGNEKSLRNALRIPRKKIERLRKLANIEPLVQGRHRGKNPGQVRDATNIEKEEARDIARLLIHSFLNYLQLIDNNLKVERKMF